jgi:hypothetical protein
VQTPFPYQHMSDDDEGDAFAAMRQGQAKLSKANGSIPRKDGRKPAPMAPPPVLPPAAGEDPHLTDADDGEEEPVEEGGAEEAEEPPLKPPAAEAELAPLAPTL